MAKNPANPGGKGPKVTPMSGNKGPIFGKATSLSGTTAPWYPNKGTNKGIGKVKK